MYVLVDGVELNYRLRIKKNAIFVMFKLLSTTNEIDNFDIMN